MSKDLCDLLIRILEEKKPYLNQSDIVESLAAGHAPEFTPFFLVENVLGIPKKALVKAYVSAKVEFFELLNRLSIGRGTRFCDVDETSGASLQQLTKVMLLFDSEHQTAANARFYLLNGSNIRKQLVRRNIVPATTELEFLNLIFKSPLPRHTKSPILWTHRRFVIEFLSNLSSQKGQLSTIPSLHEEMTVILAAAERHPKNYYAWTYARWIWLHLGNEPESQSRLPQLNERIRSWCMSNISDISGWMFYLWFLGADRPWRSRLEQYQKPMDAVWKVLHMGREVIPGHEALWTFVRGSAIGMEGVLNEDERERVMTNMAFTLRGLQDGEGRLPVAEEKNLYHISRAIKFFVKAGYWPFTSNEKDARPEIKAS